MAGEEFQSYFSTYTIEVFIWRSIIKEFIWWSKKKNLFGGASRCVSRKVKLIYTFCVKVLF
jgi:hypothetical protein